MLVFFRDSFDIRRSTWSIEWPVRCISANLIFHSAFVTQRKTKSRHSFLVERIFVRERWLRPFASFSRLNIVFLEMWFHLTAILNRCDCIWPSLCFHRQFSIYFRLWNFQDGECRSCRITVNLGNRISQLKFFYWPGFCCNIWAATFVHYPTFSWSNLQQILRQHMLCRCRAVFGFVFFE